VTLLIAFALAHQGYVARAWALLDQNGLVDPRRAMAWFIGGRPMAGWLVDQLTHVRKLRFAVRPVAGSGSFLKKRTKKLLPNLASACPDRPKPK
jgi:hypothetical protein